MRIYILSVLMLGLVSVYGCSTLDSVGENVSVGEDAVESQPNVPENRKMYWEGTWKVLRLNDVDISSVRAVWTISRSSMDLRYGSSCTTSASLAGSDGKYTRTISSSSCKGELVGSSDSVEFVVDRSNKLGIVFGKSGAVWVCKKI